MEGQEKGINFLYLTGIKFIYLFIYLKVSINLKLILIKMFMVSPRATTKRIFFNLVKNYLRH